MISCVSSFTDSHGTYHSYKHARAPSAASTPGRCALLTDQLGNPQCGCAYMERDLRRLLGGDLLLREGSDAPHKLLHHCLRLEVASTVLDKLDLV